MPPMPVAAPLIWLDVRRVVVRLDLEGHGEAVADVDDAGVLAHSDEQDVCGLGRNLLAELAQVHLARLVRAVLAPHDRVHRQLAAGRAASEVLADLLVLVGLEAEVGVRLLDLGIGLGILDGVDVPRHASTSWLITEEKNPSPSSDGPVSVSTACSGCGMRPTTLPRSLVMPAMSR